MRVGMGYDVHRLVSGRDMIIGGVKIDYEQGLLGHSDADVLLHAISDALLGAAALGDIGKHFPDTDDKYKGISSLILLKEVGNMLEEQGYLINNIDATIIAQAPKMRPYIDEMRANIAYLRHSRDYSIKPELKSLKRFWNTINCSKYYDANSYPVQMLLRSIQRYENDLTTINEEIAELKENLKTYMTQKGIFYQKVREYRKNNTKAEDK